MTTTNTLETPDGKLYYEVRGSGPLLLAMGAPMDSTAFAPFAELMAEHYTVVTHDPRGISNSPLNDPEQDSTPELRADDVAALIGALGAKDADVLGSSGGAVTVLDLAARYPDKVRTVVAHEPPVLTLLPDAEARLAATEENVAIFHKDGIGAAWMQFMINAGFDLSGDGVPEGPDEPSAQDLANSVRFFAHELLGTARYAPDIAALKDGPARIVVGVGAESGDLLTCRTSSALASRLGVTPFEFPGGHGGFAEQPEAFAATFRELLGAMES
jgi:pimeloyl-ACP methyl ester carboxylesterase